MLIFKNADSRNQVWEAGLKTAWQGISRTVLQSCPGPLHILGRTAQLEQCFCNY